MESACLENRCLARIDGSIRIDHAFSKLYALRLAAEELRRSLNYLEEDSRKTGVSEILSPGWTKVRSIKTESFESIKALEPADSSSKNM